MANETDVATRAPAPTTFDVERYRNDFPILKRSVHGRPLVYLDNAATSQKPQSVIDRMSAYYENENSNIHRGVHHLSQVATQAYEDTRVLAQRFLNAAKPHEVIFTRGTTESINLVAATYGRQHVGRGDIVIISAMEHHSNIVPWQMLCEEKGAHLHVIPISNEGELLFGTFIEMLSERVKLVAVPHVSNTLGTINPIKRIVDAAHRMGVPVLVDGAQAVPHMEIDVQDLGCDFYCFSSHKMFGPTGFGVLYGREALLEDMPPYQGGGDMIKTVTFEKTTYNDLPHKFEAGTPSIAQGIGFGAAIQYLNEIGMDAVATYEHELLEYATNALASVEDIRFIGTAREKASVISFLIGDIHPYDGGTILDRLGIAIRTGHHCTQPLMDRFGIPGTMRASFAFYNTRDEVDALVAGVEKAREMLA